MAAPRPAESTRVARVLDRVATLVRAGIPAARAWWVVAEREEGLGSVARAARGGTSITAALDAVGRAGGAGRRARPRGTGAGPDPRVVAHADPGVWSDVAALWDVAERTGAPVAPTLDALATALRERADADRAVDVALAGPRASGRVVLSLPAVGLLLGLLWGPDTLRWLTTSPPGWACVVGAGLLVAVARAWTARLVTRATPMGPVPGLTLEVWAVALSAGGSRAGAERLVADALRGRSVPAAEQSAIVATTELADAVGVPAAGLLRASASDVRRDVAAAQVAAAGRLGVQLVLPLGVCLLPAFVLVGIVPVVAGIFSSTVEGLR